MELQVVFNRDTVAKYGGRVRDSDGTSSDIYYVPVEDSSDKAWTTPPPYVTLTGDTTKSVQERSSFILSSTFDAIIMDPKDFSCLYLLLSDLQRQFGRPSSKHLVECWDLWQPILTTVWKNIGSDTANELMRIREEIEVASVRGSRYPIPTKAVAYDSHHGSPSARSSESISAAR